MATEVIYEIGIGHGDPGYDTIAAWESDTQVDCVASGVVIIGQLITRGTYDEDGITIAGATTDNDNYRMLRPAPSSIGSGLRGSGPMIYSDAGSFGAVLDIQEDFLRVADLEISSDGIVSQHGIIVNAANTGVALSGLVLYDLAYAGISFQGSGTASNCIVHHAATLAALGAFQGNSSDTSRAEFRFCTALAETTDNNKEVTGFRYCKAHNCASFHYGGSAGHQDFLNLAVGSQNNASSDAAGGGAGGQTSLTATDEFVNITSGSSTDLHLKGGSNLIDAGSGITGLSGVLIDIDRTTRGTPPDVGADEFVVVDPGTNVNINDNDLVFLYRYTNFDAADDQKLTNLTQAPLYINRNLMALSGVVEKVDGPGSSAPLSSGARASGNLPELFHLPLISQSGNASGVDFSTSQDFSFGGWFLHGDHASSQNLTYMGKHSFGGGNVRSFALSVNSGSSPQFAWRAQIGTSNGTSSTAVRGAYTVASGAWEHIVCTVDADTSSDNIILYVSGIMVASGSATVSPGTSGGHPPFRLFGDTSSTSEGMFNVVASTDRGGIMAETMLFHRTLSTSEVLGIYQSGVQAAAGAISDSDTNDTQKDNQASGAGTTATIVLTAWDASDSADPSGIRHTTSGFHPAFIKILGIGGGSGLDFGTFVQGSPSSPKAITFRANDTGNILHDMRVWSSDLSAFAGVIGYEPTLHINSDWIPNLVLPSGSGVVGKNLAAASSILRSDGNTTLSGYVTHDASQSGEQEISQYVYLAIDTSNDMTAGDYGNSGFEFRVTYDTENPT